MKIKEHVRGDPMDFWYVERGVIKKVSRIGLIGTITHDVISREKATGYVGLGGVLYQAAVFCGLEKEVALYTNLGQELSEEFDKTTQSWMTLHKLGVNRVPGPGNRVVLHYPLRGERVEILKSVVPPLNPEEILDDLSSLDFLVAVINSGFDVEKKDWLKIRKDAVCPLWLDIHSLFLEKKLNAPRRYVSFPDWRDWTEGVHYLQANRAEVAAMLGHPGTDPSEFEVRRIGEMALKAGTRAVFVTLGKEGALVVTEDQTRKIRVAENTPVVDSTGCGDVFCAGTVVKLDEGSDPVEAAQFGMQLASAAVSVSGVAATFELARHQVGVRLS